MGSYIQRFNKILAGFIVLITIFFSVACSQSTPELRNTNYSIIFDYTKPGEAPEVRLSVFVESEGDVRRSERMCITSNEAGYIWDFDDIKKIEINDIQYAGSTNLVVPENEKLPNGSYTVKYITADEKEVELNFTIRYDEDFYNLKEADVEKKMLDRRAVRKISIYDKNDIMLYYGIRSNELRTTRDIWNMYRDAEYYQDIWCLAGNTIMFILPLNKVVPEI